MKKPMYKVTFRNSYDRLTCMFTENFTSVQDAKKAIEFDGRMFKDAHSLKTLNMVGDKFRQYARWINPKTEDYYLVRGEDGNWCIYQYFKI